MVVERVSWRGREVVTEHLGSGPDVVLCHGTPWSRELWRPVAEALSDRYSVHLWDMPGYGASSKHPDHAVDLGVQGELLADLLKTWGLDAPHVVAHDIGGTVALRAHLRHGAAYSSLLLVDVVALRPWGSPFFRLVHDHVEVFLALPPAIHRGALTAYVEGASHHGLTDAQRDTLLAPWLDDEGQAAFYRQIAQADERYTAELEPVYADLDLPVRIVWGEEDTWIPVDRATRLADAIPGATVRTIPGAGHLVQYDAAEPLLTEVTRWLHELTGAGW